MLALLFCAALGLVALSLSLCVEHGVYWLGCVLVVLGAIVGTLGGDVEVAGEVLTGGTLGALLAVVGLALMGWGHIEGIHGPGRLG